MALTDHKGVYDSLTIQGKVMTNEDKFFEWWNGDEMVDDLDVVKHTPLYWAMQGWEAALREMNKEAEKNGEPL